MNFKEVLQDPFMKGEQFHTWSKDFSLNRKNVKFVNDMIVKVGGDLSLGEYIQSVLYSKSVGSNPKKFLIMLATYDDNEVIQWVIGKIRCQYKINSLNNIEECKPMEKIGFIDIWYTNNGYSRKLKVEIQKLWDMKDDTLIPHLIAVIAYIGRKHDISQFLLDVDNKHLLRVIDILCYNKMDISKLKPLLFRGVTYSTETAGETWMWIYHQIDDPRLIARLAMITFRNWKFVDLQNFEWCLQEKAKKLPEVIPMIVDKIHQLEYFNRRTIWRPLTLGNPMETVTCSSKLFELDKGDRLSQALIGECFNEIKQMLYRTKNKEASVELCLILNEWAKGRDFITIKEKTRQELNALPPEKVVNIIHEITEQLISNKVSSTKTEILGKLSSIPKLNLAVQSKVASYLDKKKYHPILEMLSIATLQEHRNNAWAINVLATLEYFFQNFPTIPNGKYSVPSEAITHKTLQLFSNFDSFLSEALIFERLHKANCIKQCEPAIEGRHPEFLVVIDNKETIVEVKHPETSEDLRLSGFGNKMENKFKRDIIAAFTQIVSFNPPHRPVIIAFDTSKSGIDQYMFDNFFAGTLNMSFNVYSQGQKPKKDDVKSFRAADYLVKKYPQAKYVQGIIFFRPFMKGCQLSLQGFVGKNYVREQIFSDKQLDNFGKYLYC